MATRLPSGNYRTQVFIGYSRGRRQYKSFTAESAKKADLAALQWQSEHPSVNVSGTTLTVAMDAFIRARSPVLSPSTIRGYVSIQTRLKKDFGSLCRKKIDVISADDLQGLVNALVKSGSSSKTVKNYYGFLCSVWSERGLTIPSVTLPQKVKPQFNIPDEETIKRLYQAAEGTQLEIPILLGSIGAMRRGEIVAADISDLDGNVLHVHRAAVVDARQRQIIKEYPKTFESTRDVVLPQKVADKIRAQGFVCDCTLNYISTMFPRLLRRCGIQHFRFHDLRHAFVSICHAAGIPDAYIQQRGGWATNYTMNNVYRHTLSDTQREENKKINGILEEIL